MGDPVSLSILAAGKGAMEIGQSVASYRTQKDQIALDKQTVRRKDDEDAELFTLRAQDRMSEFLARTGKVNSYAAAANIAGGGSVTSLQQSAAMATAIDQYVDTRAINTSRYTSQIKLAALDRELRNAKKQLALNIAGSLIGVTATTSKIGAAGAAQSRADATIDSSYSGGE